MTSQNNILRSEQWSALIVTMLLVSVLLVTALILLQRIIPYAKSVRSMHDASQAYYVARGQTDLARYNFLYSWGNLISLQFPSIFWLLSENSLTWTTVISKWERDSIYFKTADGTYKQLTFDSSFDDGVDPVKIWLPFYGKKHNDNVIISGDIQNPLQIKLFSTDDNSQIKKFGTSKVDARYHTLYARNAGGLRFDLRGVKTDLIATGSFKLQFSWLITATLTLKMQYFSGGNTDVKTFTKEYTISNSNTVTLNPSSGDGNIQTIKTDGTISPWSWTLDSFLDNDCSDAKICSLTLTLNPGGPSSIDFQLISDQQIQIPDLNAIVVWDGLSWNGIYYQRVIDLIPTPQDI